MSKPSVETQPPGVKTGVARSFHNPLQQPRCRTDRGVPSADARPDSEAGWSTELAGMRMAEPESRGDPFVCSIDKEHATPCIRLAFQVYGKSREYVCLVK